MPKELTHWLIAERAAAGLGAENHLRRAIEDHRSAYLAGAVLPDTLLHLFRGPHASSALHLARSFHDTTGNSFAPVIHAERTFPGKLPPALLASLLGVITHIATDIIFHPFVYAQTGTAGVGRHYQIETGIDGYFLLNGTLPAITHLKDLMSPDTQETIVTTCNLILNPAGTLPRTALEQALAFHCRFQAMYGSTFWKLAVRLLAVIVGSPFSEQRHLFYPLSHAAAAVGIEDGPMEWRHPVSGEQRCSTPEVLANDAVQRIIELFTTIDTSGSLAGALEDSPGENLLTGLHGIGQSAMISG